MKNINEQSIQQLEFTREYISKAALYFDAMGGVSAFDDEHYQNVFKNSTTQETLHDMQMLDGLFKAVELVADSLRQITDDLSPEIEDLIDSQLSSTTVGQIIGQRVVLAHRYPSVEVRHVVQTIVEDYPELDRACADVIAILEERH